MFLKFDDIVVNLDRIMWCKKSEAHKIADSSPQEPCTEILFDGETVLTIPIPLSDIERILTHRNMLKSMDKIL